MRVALLGTGTMGAGMARSCKREGLDVTVWNRTTEKAQPLADDGISVADSVAAAVTGADVVVTMLYDADSVLDHLDELTGALGDDAVWLQSSTIGPDGIRRVAEAAPPGTPLVDAPMLGTKAPAEQGKLVPLVSGASELIDRARPVLDAVGAKTIVAGDEIGAASALKLVCNAWVLTVTTGTAQSVAFAQHVGLDPQLFLDAIADGATDTPYAQLKGGAMIKGDFTASFEIDGGRKDAALIADAMRDSGVRDAVFDQVKAAFDDASGNGHGDDDLAAVFTAF